MLAFPSSVASAAGAEADEDADADACAGAVTGLGAGACEGTGVGTGEAAKAGVVTGTLLDHARADLDRGVGKWERDGLTAVPRAQEK